MGNEMPKEEEGAENVGESGGETFMDANGKQITKEEMEEQMKKRQNDEWREQA